MVDLIRSPELPDTSDAVYREQHLLVLQQRLIEIYILVSERLLSQGPSGLVARCENCGGPSWDDPDFCSLECANEY